MLAYARHLKQTASRQNNQQTWGIASSKKFRLVTQASEVLIDGQIHNLCTLILFGNCSPGC
jgi:hypothetical protein